MSYSMSFQEDPPLLRLTLTGFWDLQTLGGFALDVDAVREDILRRYPRYDTLFDASGLGAQVPEIVAGFQQMQDAGRGRNPGRVAVILGSALARLQAKRAVIDPRIAVFDSEEEALAWLTDPSRAAVSHAG